MCESSSRAVATLKSAKAQDTGSPSKRWSMSYLARVQVNKTKHLSPAITILGIRTEKLHPISVVLVGTCVLYIYDLSSIVGSRCPSLSPDSYKVQAVTVESRAPHWTC